MLARVAQAFKGLEMDVDAMPLDARPPAAWARADVGERKRIEKIWPKSHLTMFVHVSGIV